MRRLALAALSAFAVVSTAFAEPRAAGFEQIAVAHSARPLRGVLWTPVLPESGAPIEALRSPAFLGVPARSGGAPAPGRFPLVLISHGFGGHYANQAWLAARLAGAGYVVAAVSHPGTSFDDRDPGRASRLEERPKDLSRLIDALLARPDLAERIDPARIAVIGHSLGAWTAMEIVGARFDPARHEADCRDGHEALAACKLYALIKAGADAPARAVLAGDLRDPRIKAAVSLDIGLARGFDPASLAALPVPVLVLAAGAPSKELPSELESAPMAHALPAATTSYAEIAGATHFSFMGRCAPGGRELIEKEAPGDGMVCDDAGRDRADIHEEVAGRVLSFLEKALTR
jgi:predicted dienelactone hydrolase